MLTIGICDSNAAHREQLQRVLKALLFEEGDVTYLQFPTGATVLQALQVQQQALDLLFLEVALPDMNGMMLASILRRDGYRLDLIFLTELERYVYDGYVYHAFDYLIKPISAKKISVCMRRYVAERLQTSKKYLTITTKGYTERLNLQQVLYFESCQRKITAVMDRHMVEFYQKLGDLYDIVVDAGFLRCHQSYVVNRRQIAALRNQTIVLLNGKEIPVSKRYLTEVKAYMSKPVLLRRMNSVIASYVSSYSGGRSENEDCADFFHKDRNWCCVLADGLGGMRYGAEAAALVVKAVKESFFSNFLRADTLEQTVLKAHEALCAYKRENRIGRGCYSTIALLYGTQEQIWWTHCGDSRVYLFRHGVLERRTKDHSVPQMLALCGEINPAEIRYHPDRNRLLSCLGLEDQLPQIAKVDSTTLEPGLALLLCSDGFWEPVTEQQMENSLTQAQDVRAWIAQMNNIVAQLPQKETLDNYTAVGVWIS